MIEAMLYRLDARYLKKITKYCCEKQINQTPPSINDD